MARAIVTSARERGTNLQIPKQVVEIPGEGLAGTIDG